MSETIQVTIDESAYYELRRYVIRHECKNFSDAILRLLQSVGERGIMDHDLRKEPSR